MSIFFCKPVNSAGYRELSSQSEHSENTLINAHLFVFFMFNILIGNRKEVFFPLVCQLQWFILYNLTY